MTDGSAGSGTLDHPSNAAYWAENIRKYRRSGLTQRWFCQEYGFSYHCLRWWLQRTKTAAALDDAGRRKPRSALIRLVGS
jgi:hypothetical protein